MSTRAASALLPVAADDRRPVSANAAGTVAGRIGDESAAWFRLSILPPALRRPHHLRAAGDSLAAASDGQIVALGNSDLLVLFSAERQGRMEAAARAVCHLFGQDITESGASGRTSFVSWYDVNRDRAELGRRLRSSGGDPWRNASPSSNEEAGDEAQGCRPAPGMLTPDRLVAVSEKLAAVDLFGLLRRQPACAWEPDQSPIPQFDELFVSMRALQRLLVPDIDLSNGRWLFRHLTEAIDQRLLAALVRSTELRGLREFSVNLNLVSVWTSAFETFDASLNAARIGTVIIEAPVTDVFIDLPRFLRTRDVLREKGYRLAIDGVPWHDLAIFDRRLLSADLMKVVWSKDLADASDHELRAFRTAVNAAGAHRIVLCRVDRPEAIDIGRSVGIALFQGRHVDDVLREETDRRHRARLKRAVRADT